MRTINASLGLSLLALAVPAVAQQPPPAPAARSRDGEVRELEALLARADAAIAALEPVVNPAVTLVQYDVRPILIGTVDWPAPSLAIPSPGAGFRTHGAHGGGGTFCFDDAAEGPPGPLDPDKVQEIVTNSVGEEQWEEPRSIEVHRGWLFVRQTAVGHARVRHVLDDLVRRAQRAVQLEVGFYGLTPELQAELEEAALAQNGVLVPAALARLDQAVAGGTARLASCALLSALDGQRVYLHQGQERSYVANFELSSGGTGQVVDTVADPMIKVLRAGLTLDVRTTLVARDEGAVAALDVRFARARPLEVTRRTTAWGLIETPQVTSDAVRTSAQVPTGAGMLVFSARGTADDGTSDVAIVVRPRLVE
jgi:hypothetical protein